MKNNLDCLFCQIIEGQVPSYKIYEDQYCYAFLDRFPVSEGHTLVVPKKHFCDWSTTDEEDLKATAVATQKTQKLLQKKLNPLGFNYVSNEKAISYQVIFHFHIHIIPKYREKDGYLLKKNINNKRTVEEIFAVLQS